MGNKHPSPYSNNLSNFEGRCGLANPSSRMPTTIICRLEPSCDVMISETCLVFQRGPGVWKWWFPDGGSFEFWAADQIPLPSFTVFFCRKIKKKVFFCICICYEITIMSEIIYICYAGPSELQRTAVSASATEFKSKIEFSSVSVLTMKCKLIQTKSNLCM